MRSLANRSRHCDQRAGPSLTGVNAHYPLVQCHDHALAPGFIACVHVLAGAPVAHRIEPADVLGKALCATCQDITFEPNDEALSLLRLICVHCLERVIADARPT